MADALTHETLFRGDLKNLLTYTFWIGGCGALGSNIAEGLARHGASNFVLIDFDRIEMSNLGTQPWYLEEVGKLKADNLSKRLYRINKAKAIPIVKKLESNNVDEFFAKKYIPDPTKTIVIDAFDNSEVRSIICNDIPEVLKKQCIHSGMSNDGYGEVVWNENYVVPKKKKAGLDVCEYPMVRNLVIFTATLCIDVIVDYLLTNKKYNYEFTLSDKVVRKKECL